MLFGVPLHVGFNQGQTHVTIVIFIFFRNCVLLFEKVSHLKLVCSHVSGLSSMLHCCHPLLSIHPSFIHFFIFVTMQMQAPVLCQRH